MLGSYGFLNYITNNLMRIYCGKQVNLKVNFKTPCIFSVLTEFSLKFRQLKKKI